MERLENGVNVQIIKSDKFKTDYITVRYMLEFVPEFAQARSMLAMILSEKCAKYPSLHAMTNYLDYNYGMNASMKTYSYGSGHLIELKTSSVNDLFVNNDSINKQLELIDEIIFNPLLADDGLFDGELFEEGKILLESRIAHRDEDPVTYAFERASRCFGKGTIFEHSVLGEIDDLKDLTREMVFEAYRDLRNKARVDVIVVTSDDEKVTLEKVKKYRFADKTLNNIKLNYDFKQQDVLEIEEEKEIDQTTLIAAYHTDILANHPDYYVLKVANLMFGGDTNSLMFKEIREKKSYCYSIASSIYSMDGIIFAYAGISYENKDMVLMMINELVERLKNGDFEQELETAKLIYINELLSNFDSASGIMTYHYRQALFNETLKLDDMILKIKQISKNDIVRVMNTWKYIGSYTLKECEDNE